MKNIKGYAWKNERTAAFYHATAEQAHEAFEEIRRRDGKLTPAAVVDSARPEESVLHEDFEWRDDVAAEKYRQGQARQMVGAVEQHRTAQHHDPAGQQNAEILRSQ